MDTKKTDTILETERLLLRVFRPEDLDAFAEIEADPEVMRFYASGPRSRERAEQGVRYFIGLQERHGFSPWAVIDKADDCFIGYCGLLPQTIDGQEEVEVGYKLARAYWRRGLATEAAYAVRDWGFTHLAVLRLISIINPSNAASIRVAQKNGLRHEKDADYGGTTCRIYTLDRREWERPDV
ncbi:MAG: GNAT family N-acetyltransferase [Janthinobacterium lividum]